MHFVNLFIKENETLENVSLATLEDDFYEDFCYDCGKRWDECPNPICDWFQIGGRWSKQVLSATKGKDGEHSLLFDTKTINKIKKSPKFDICEINDLTEPIKKEMIYGICYNGEHFILKDNDFWSGDKPSEEGIELLNKINNKQIGGVIAVIDCHD